MPCRFPQAFIRRWPHVRPVSRSLSCSLSLGLGFVSVCASVSLACLSVRVGVGLRNFLSICLSSSLPI